jgi:DNA gyrase/topoisomerase IV subunit B
LRITVDGELEADRVLSELMGKDPSARYRFIMERAPQAVDLDV